MVSTGGDSSASLGMTGGDARSQAGMTKDGTGGGKLLKKLFITFGKSKNYPYLCGPQLRPVGPTISVKY